MIYQKGDSIHGYKVLLLLGDDGDSQTYRVRGTDGLLYALKTNPAEIETKAAAVSAIYAGADRDYLVTRYISGETLELRLKREGSVAPVEATRIISDLLEQLKAYHEAGYAHGDICATHVLMDMTVNPPRPWLVGLAKASAADATTVMTDLRGMGELMYRMIFNEKPTIPLKIPVRSIPDLDEKILNIMYNSVAGDFDSAEAMASALRGGVTVARTTKPMGPGFKAVAGMDDIKQRLQDEVIDILADREGALRYGITVPNGMLLYGPPGCGKTFIAEKFAEQANYNYRYVKSSDLASIYLHGSQEKIGTLFKEARENAPTILCFDEFDALVPRRDDVHNASHSGEVNEFLSQLNNCGHDGVFVIATTNRPDRIDPAVLRTGRIDYIVYVPLPDDEARKALFGIALNDRPIAAGIDTAVLARMTKGYIASDITAIVQECARKAFKTKSLITMQMLVDGVGGRRPSLSPKAVADYERLRTKFESGDGCADRPKVGFM